MKILVVHNSYLQPGGEDRVFEQECTLLREAGHMVVEYRRSNHEIEGFSRLERVLLVKRMVWASDTYRDFSHLLQREKPDVVHIHNTFFVISPAVYSACRHAGIPVIHTLHNFRLMCPAAEFARAGQVCEECLEHGVWRGVRYACYRGSRSTTAAMALTLTVHRGLGTWDKGVARYIALTDFARQKFISGGFPADRISVKPNFVHPDPGQGAANGRSYALFVGRLPRVKGVNTLITAWRRVNRNMPLWIVGDGPERPELEAQAQRAGLENVIFKGRLPNSETIAAIKGARFLAFPSEWYENFPVTIAEAFACGTPVLCSRLGSMQEIVADGRTGLHFRPGDPDDLSAKVEYAWSHPADMQTMGANARLEFEARYTARANYASLMSIYQDAIACYA